MTETGIANLALSHLGSPGIVSISEAIPEAEAVRDCWAGVRDALLRAHRWNFAKARQMLTPVVPGQVYQLPSDCLRPLRINGLEQPGASDLGAEVEGRHLLVSADYCELQFIRRIVNPEDWDPLFTVVFAYQLAAAAGPRISNGSQSLSESMVQKAEIQMKYAMAANAVESKATVSRAIDGSRYLDAVAGSRRRKQVSQSPSSIPTVASGSTAPQPVISYVKGSDGAWYEKTTLPDGTEFFKLVYLILP